jgi:hypothetical protein
MSKSKGADAPKKEKEVSTEKFLNLGVDVVFKNGETVSVRELSFNSLVAVLAKASNALAGMGSEPDAHFLTALTGDEKTHGVLHEVFAASTGKDPDYFLNLPATDGFKLISAINKVNDFAEIFSVFREMGLQKILPAFTEAKNPKG